MEKEKCSAKLSLRASDTHLCNPSAANPNTTSIAIDEPAAAARLLSKGNVHPSQPSHAGFDITKFAGFFAVINQIRRDRKELQRLMSFKNNGGVLRKMQTCSGLCSDAPELHPTSPVTDSYHDWHANVQGGMDNAQRPLELFLMRLPRTEVIWKEMCRVLKMKRVNWAAKSCSVNRSNYSSREMRTQGMKPAMAPGQEPSIPRRTASGLGETTGGPRGPPTSKNSIYIDRWRRLPGYF
jgi:hypothetical protein